MKYPHLNMLLLSIALILILSSCENEKKSKSTNSENQVEQKTTEVSPEVVFENDYAKVVKVSLAPNESLPAHEGENRVIYSLTDYSINWEEKGQNVGTKTWKKGEVHYHESGKHAATNIGSTTAEWLVFSKKNGKLPTCGENLTEKDVNSVLSEIGNVLLDNDEFKVTEITLPTNAIIPLHAGINRVIYSLSDYEIMYNSNNEDKREKTFKSGDIHWHDACQHGVKNIGQTKAQYLVIGYKR